MWFVYAATIPLVMINSIRELVGERQATFKMNFDVPLARAEVCRAATSCILLPGRSIRCLRAAQAWSCSILSVIYVLLPFYFLPFWTALPLAVVSNVFSSLFFSLQFVVNRECQLSAAVAIIASCCTACRDCSFCARRSLE
jgi:hypothetical protein